MVAHNKPRARRVLRGALLFCAAVAAAIAARLLLGLVLGAENSRPTVTDVERARALRLHRASTVVDGHNDVPTWITDFGFDLAMNGAEDRDGTPILALLAPGLVDPPPGDEVRTQTDLGRAQEGGLDAQFFSIWVACSHLDPERPGAATQRAFAVIDALDASVKRSPERITIASSVRELRAATAAGRLAAMMGVEGGHAIEDSLTTLERLYDRGVRYMTLTHTCSHGWADASTDDPRHGGLTDFGREVVATMNRLGMIVDISHVSDETFWDTLEVARAPVMASHSSARTVANHPRNMTDEMLRAVAQNGGVVMVNFLANYVDPRKTGMVELMTGWFWFTHPGGTHTPLTAVADHIDHMVAVAGVDHVGLGSDFDGGPFFPEDLGSVADFPNLTVELVRRGYRDEDIEKILGGNAIRVWEAVEAVARGSEG